MNYWHSRNAYVNKDKQVNVLVEIPKGTNVKYEVSIKGDCLESVRQLNKRYKYPFNYGFITGTYGGDSDPLDAIVIGKKPITPLTMVECDVLGVIRTIDNGEQDDKIIVIPKYLKDMKRRKFRRYLRKYMRFLKKYKYPYNHDTQIFKPKSRELAIEIIDESISLYNKIFNKKETKQNKPIDKKVVLM